MRWAETTQPSRFRYKRSGETAASKRKDMEKKRKNGERQEGKRKKKRNKGVTGHMVPEWSKHTYTGRAADVADKITAGV